LFLCEEQKIFLSLTSVQKIEKKGEKRRAKREEKQILKGMEQTNRN